MKVFIAKIFNPAIDVTSLPLSIKIDHVTVATNNVEELYYDTYDVFMNSQDSAASADTTLDCNVFSPYSAF
jgi:hypothetical protein